MSIIPTLNYQQLWLALGLLPVLILIIFLWYLPANRDTGNWLHTLDNSQPDYFGYHVVSWKYNTSGFLNSKLKAVAIKHYPVDGVTWLTQPRLWSYGMHRQVDWYAVSDRGKMLSDHKTFQMLDNVIVTQPATEDRAAVHLKTNEMTLYMGKKMADVN